MKISVNQLRKIISEVVSSVEEVLPSAAQVIRDTKTLKRTELIVAYNDGREDCVEITITTREGDVATGTITFEDLSLATNAGGYVESVRTVATFAKTGKTIPVKLDPEEADEAWMWVDQFDVNERLHLFSGNSATAILTMI